MSPIELLLAVSSIGILLLLVVFLIDRSLALERARDLTRFNDVQLFMGSLLQYQIDTEGKIPEDLDSSRPEDWHMIGIEGQVCTDYCPNEPRVRGCVYLPELTPRYIPRIPQDSFFTDLGPSGYYINTQPGHIVTVGACVTEALPSIEQKQ